MLKKIVFLTGTRADYGKQKSLIASLASDSKYKATILVCGMHLILKYGLTVTQILEDNLAEINIFPEGTSSAHMEITLAETIKNLSDFVDKNSFDLLVIHGDRVEALAGAIVGSIRNIPVAHIEGGEVSGTIDGLMRHSVSKLSNIHFVSNSQAEKRLIQLGESKDSIYTIGSPDIDIMFSDELPSLIEVTNHYEILFEKYNVVILHPVTTEYEQTELNCTNFCKALIESNEQYIVIKPNNDFGSEIIQNTFEKLLSGPNFKHIPSMRFEYFLTLMKNANFVIGNSSAGIRECAYYGVPAINVGSRQTGRHTNKLIINTDNSYENILKSIFISKELERKPIYNFGNGNSAEQFKQILDNVLKWPIPTSKTFLDI
jgi:UDP-N-acetylglucosamine 2-epimerase (hydrolysing)